MTILNPFKAHRPQYRFVFHCSPWLCVGILGLWLSFVISLYHLFGRKIMSHTECLIILSTHHQEFPAHQISRAIRSGLKVLHRRSLGRRLLKYTPFHFIKNRVWEMRKGVLLFSHMVTPPDFPGPIPFEILDDSLWYQRINCQSIF